PAARRRTRTPGTRNRGGTRPFRRLLRSAFRERRADVNRDEAQQLLVVELGQLHLVRAVEELPRQVLRGRYQRVDLLLARPAAHELVHQHAVLLADAVGAIRRLALGGGVPPAIEVNDVAGGRQVEAGAAGLQRQHEEGRTVVALELLDEAH